MPADRPRALLAMVFPQERQRREPGVGRRDDMIYWGEWTDDGSVRPVREPSTAALALAYQVTGAVGYATRAFRQAAVKLAMARRVLRGGREHADMGGAVCSVAAGHGRNWGYGAVTGCYGPLLVGTRQSFGRLAPSVEVEDERGRRRLPDGVLSLVRPPVAATGEVALANLGNAPATFSWRPTAAPDWIRLTLAPGERHTAELPRRS
jgi:hypothetical protein